MDKPSSIVAALNAGKLPSTQQFNILVEYLEQVGLVKLQDGADAAQGEGLSKQGKVLADDLREVLNSVKNLLSAKNADNILQEAVWHLTQGTLSSTLPKASSASTTTKESARRDLDAVQQCIRTLLGALCHSLSAEGSTLLASLLSLVRTSLSDALEAVEGKAAQAKQGLRRVEGEVQEGTRDALGRDKERLEEERQDTRVAWEHAADAVKGMGGSVIGGAQGAQEKLGHGKEVAEGALKETYFSIWERAQSDPEYRQALNTLFSILQDRLHTALDKDKVDKPISLSSFIDDPTPEQHLPKGIALLRTFAERLAGEKSLEPALDSTRSALAAVLQDEGSQLRVWFDDFLAYARRTLADVQHAHSDEAQATRTDLRERWKGLRENPEWNERVERVKTEWTAFEEALREDKDLKAVKAAQQKMGEDLKTRLSGEEGQGGVERALEEITWFWQDLFKVYLPNILDQLKDVPIPRTEYKDDDIEFVLENLDISRLNLFPSHVYIRNITDIAIQTFDDPSVSADKQLATLTHIQLQAVQMHLKDVSFWYKDKHAATVVPGEFTGLLEMRLPPQGINVDLKVRMIPAKAKGKLSREEQRRFHVVERCAVEISDEVSVSVRESNHAMLVNVFSGLVKRRIKEAMERTLTGQFRALVDWFDGVAYDVGERRKVFEDAGLGGAPAVVAALWSELGRLERESEEGGVSLGVKATASGIVFEEKMEVPIMTESGKFEYEVGKQTKARVLAVGVEPQVLSGEKRGPLGTGSESVQAEGGMGLVKEGKRRVEQAKKRVEGFRNAVLRKEKDEKKTVDNTWRSDAVELQVALAASLFDEQKEDCDIINRQTGLDGCRWTDRSQVDDP